MNKNKIMVLTEKELAKAWLEAEQKMGFLTNVSLEELVANKTIYDEIYQSHAKATAEAQLDKAIKCFEAEIEKARKDEREKILAKIKRNPFRYLKPAWDSIKREYSGDIEVREREWQALVDDPMLDKWTPHAKHTRP